MQRPSLPCSHEQCSSSPGSLYPGRATSEHGSANETCIRGSCLVNLSKFLQPRRVPALKSSTRCAHSALTSSKCPIHGHSRGHEHEGNSPPWSLPPLLYPCQSLMLQGHRPFDEEPVQRGTPAFPTNLSKPFLLHQVISLLHV